MHFTSYDLLKNRIDSRALDILTGEDPSDEDGVLGGAIAEADAAILAYTGIAPSDDNHRLLVGAAGDIVINILSGQQAGIDENEMTRRQKNFNNAIHTCELIRDGRISIGTAAAAAAEEHISPTVGGSFPRMTNY